MKNGKALRRLVLLTVILALSSVIAAGIYTRASRPQKQQRDCTHTYDAAKATEPPQVISIVKGLEITGVRLINQGTVAASVVIDVTNNRDEAVMAVDFISGKDDRGGILMDGLLEEDNPQAIIPPHSLQTFTWGLGEIIEGTPATLASAVFSDGKEEGDKQSLHGMKIGRLQYQQQQRERKLRPEVRNERKTHHCIRGHRFHYWSCNRHRRPLWQHLGSTSADIRAHSRTQRLYC
jgi:hypothetical protein